MAAHHCLLIPLFRCHMPVRPWGYPRGPSLKEAQWPSGPVIAHVAASADLRRTWFIAAQTTDEYSTAATQTELVTSACMLSHECLCLALYNVSLYLRGLTSARSRLFFSLL